MPVTVVCPACKARLKAPDALVGKMVKCPGCAKPVLVKAMAPAAPSAPRSAQKSVKQPGKQAVKQPAPALPEDEVIDEIAPVEDEVETPRKKRKRANGEEAGTPPPGGPSTDKERGTAMWIHLLPIVLSCCGGIGTLISLFMWFTKRKESAFIDHHGKTWLNFVFNLFAISLLLVPLSGVLSFVASSVSSTLGAIVGGLVGLLMAVVGVYSLVMHIVVGLKAKKGEWAEYRVLFRVLK